jgi:hypothetical protein
VLKGQNQLIDVGVALATKRAAIGDAILDVEDKAARGFGSVEHRAREWEEPLNIAIWMNSTVGTSIRVGRTCEKQIYALSRKARHQLA